MSEAVFVMFNIILCETKTLPGSYIQGVLNVVVSTTVNTERSFAIYYLKQNGTLNLKKQWLIVKHLVTLNC